jgi:hypothetical protein
MGFLKHEETVPAYGRLCGASYPAEQAPAEVLLVEDDPGDALIIHIGGARGHPAQLPAACQRLRHQAHRLPRVHRRGRQHRRLLPPPRPPPGRARKLRACLKLTAIEFASGGAITSPVARSKGICGVPQAMRPACSQGRWTARNGVSSAIQSRAAQIVHTRLSRYPPSGTVLLASWVKSSWSRR